MNTFATLIDAGFVKTSLDSADNPTAAEDIQALVQRICKHPTLAGQSLYRVYFYDALVSLTLSPAYTGEKNFLVILRVQIARLDVSPLPNLNVFKYSLVHLLMTHHQRLTVNGFPLQTSEGERSLTRGRFPGSCPCKSYCAVAIMIASRSVYS